MNIFVFFAKLCRTGLDESYDDFKSAIKMEKEGLSANEAIFQIIISKLKCRGKLPDGHYRYA